MAYIGNTPSSNTILRIEARKSFSLGLHVYDSRARNADLTGCEITIIAKPYPLDNTSDATNILAADALASIVVPAVGYAVFDIQAVTLNVAPGEYPFAIVLKTADGFTSVLVKGVLDLQENTEFSSVGSIFGSANPPQSLAVYPNEQGVINVTLGGQLPPGMNYVNDATLTKIDSFDPTDVAYVPDGGQTGYVLTKTTSTDYAMEWRPVGNGAFALDATAVASGYTPVAVGDGTWLWAAVGINAAGVTIGWAPIANGDGTWSWQKIGLDATGITAGFAPVANGDGTWGWATVVSAPSDWNAAVGADGEILNKPTLGSAAAASTTDFIDADTLVSAMPGMHFQTTIPVTGIEGHLYFVYTA